MPHVDVECCWEEVGGERTLGEDVVIGGDAQSLSPLSFVGALRLCDFGEKSKD